MLFALHSGQTPSCGQVAPWVFPSKWGKAAEYEGGPWPEKEGKSGLLTISFHTPSLGYA